MSTSDTDMFFDAVEDDGVEDKTITAEKKRGDAYRQAENSSDIGDENATPNLPELVEESIDFEKHSVIKPTARYSDKAEQSEELERKPSSDSKLTIDTSSTCDDMNTSESSEEAGVTKSSPVSAFQPVNTTTKDKSRPRAMENLIREASEPNFTTVINTTATSDPHRPPSISPPPVAPSPILRLTPELPSLSRASSNGDSSHSSGEDCFRVINKDTGEVHDIREIEGINSTYSLIPSRDEMLRRHTVTGSDRSLSTTTADLVEEQEREEAAPKTEEVVSKKKKKVFKGLKQNMQKGVKVFKEKSTATNIKIKSTATSVKNKANVVKNRANVVKNMSPTGSDTLPSNSVPVRCGMKSGSSDPMLLLSSLEGVHKGPIWCMKFSPDGKYLVTAGEDRQILIWEVAPQNVIPYFERKNVGSSPEKRKWRKIPRFAGGKKSRGEQRDDMDSECSSRDNQSVGSEVSGQGDAVAPSPKTMGGKPPIGEDIQLFSTTPIQTYTDHKADIVDLSWSRTNFLLSASLDKTVRLYHPSRPSCLHVFQHKDLVTSVSFHPHNDQFFLSGGFDKKLRIWSIPDGRVREWAQCPEIVTAARFTPSGKFVVAGLIHGQVYFYETEGMKYYTQIACKNRKGKQKGGKKVTGFDFIVGVKQDKDEEEDEEDDMENSFGSLEWSSEKGSKGDLLNGVDSFSPKTRAPILSTMSSCSTDTGKALLYTEQILVTTNDSRLRLYGLDDYCMIRKYKGFTNSSMQIGAHFSESGNSIVCGSEAGNVYTWSTSPKNQSLPMQMGGMHKYDRNKAHRWFEASKATLPIVTDALFAPSKSTKDALINSQLFPTMMNLDNVDCDLSSALIVTSDYDGTIRVFMQKQILDQLFRAAGPEGMGMDFGVVDAFE